MRNLNASFGPRSADWSGISGVPLAFLSSRRGTSTPFMSLEPELLERDETSGEN